MADEMVRRDDLTGEIENVERIFFSYGGKNYKIDLIEENKKKLEEAFAPYIQAGRLVEAPASAPKPTADPATRRAAAERVAAIRAWAKAQGMEVSDRGRLPFDVIEAYDAAN